MPKIDGAFKTLNKLKNLLQLKIFIFTSRDWPQLENEEDCIKNNWEKNINKITKLWLSENGLKFPCFFKTSKDVKLIIEKENKGAKNNNRRFSESIRNNIKFFVEDDLKNAIKLSYICDFIFLFDQPYNQEKNLPINVFRIKSWGEIYTKIRELI